MLRTEAHEQEKSDLWSEENDETIAMLPIKRAVSTVSILFDLRLFKIFHGLQRAHKHPGHTCILPQHSLLRLMNRPV